MARDTKSSTDGGFIQEYLYVEEMPLELLEDKRPKEKKPEEERGYIVIDLFGDS